MWLILRTDARKEAYVAQQIKNAGLEAWHPVQVIACRPHAVRKLLSKSQLATYREVAILPRRVFAAVPVALQAELEGLRHLVGIERNADQEAISVPSSQISAFRAVIDAENRAALMLSQKASRKQKAKWKSLHDALLDMMEEARNQLEQAA